ncbi:ABC transporter substrate-binding protein [Streptomyces litchfieldiae]|uniref:Extracellular solute-binding protein n=1 Tax=Streptomyces litchfieldiae TaxID=3075543 RepID=A0ABU2MNV8_9ACTN|nr:extracellular solute-binding protein [Streptomyces sp. DSM 44938]MDT0343312.1 extracellular solute-binding protein [Streptomyces sp. DSM 44938]
MRRRRFMGLTAGLTSAIGLSATTTACGGSGGGDGHLRMLAAELTDDGSSQRYWEELVADFNAEHPDIQVTVTLVPFAEATEEAARLVAEGDAPDLAQLASFAEFATQGQLYSANDVLNVPVQSDFIPAVAAAGEVRRIQYAMPVFAIIQRLFYNKALFDQAGLDPDSPPQSWNELLDAASALRTADVPIPFGLPFGHSDSHVEAVLWMLAGGGHLTDAAGSYTIESPANVETFTWLRDELTGQGLTGEAKPEETGRHDLYEQFVSGRVGMLTADPMLLPLCEAAGLDAGTGTVPGRRGASLSTVGEASWLLAFNQHGKREQIGTFLNWAFSGGYENVSGFADENQLLPISTPTSQAMAVSDSPNHQRLRPFIDELPSATFFPSGKVSWNTVALDISREIGNTVREGSDVADILGRLQSAAEEADRDAEA